MTHARTRTLWGSAVITAVAAGSVLAGVPALAATVPALAATVPAPAGTSAGAAVHAPAAPSVPGDVAVGDLLDVRIGDVHPTQPAVGFDQVSYKLGRYSELGKDAVNKRFDDWCEANGQGEAATAPAGATLHDPASFTCTVPLGGETTTSLAAMKTVVLGPDGGLWLTDGHHTLTSFAETADGGLDLHVRLRVSGDLRDVAPADFWPTMEARGWTWLQDPDGRRVSPDQLPATVGLAGFQDDPLRSLVYYSRDIGLTAGTVEFQEFAWGAWLRDESGIDLSGWDRDDLGSYLATVRAVSEAMVALPGDAPIGDRTADELGRLARWNDGKAADKGEFGKLSRTMADDKPGKLAYALAWRAAHPEAPAEPGTPEQPGTGEPEQPGGPGTPEPGVPEQPGTGEPGTPEQPGTPGDDAPTAPVVAVTGDLRAGGAVTVRAAGLTPAARATVEVRSTPRSLGSATVAADGTLVLRAVLPADLPAGTHTVAVLVDGRDVATTPVTVAGAGGGTTGSDQLAHTGASLTGAAAAGLLLLVAGALLARRRRA